MSKRPISDVDEPQEGREEAAKRPRTSPRRVAFVPIGSDLASPLEDTLNGICFWEETPETAPSFIDFFRQEIKDLSRYEKDDLTSLPVHYINYMLGVWKKPERPPHAMSEELLGFKPEERGRWTRPLVCKWEGEMGFEFTDMPTTIHFYCADVLPYGFEDSMDDTVLVQK